MVQQRPGSTTYLLVALEEISRLLNGKSCPRSAGPVFQCEATRPSQGWPDAPPVARNALETIGAKRREILKNRGLLVIRLPARPHADEGEFRWIVDPTEHEEIDDAAWYFDGSMINGRWRALRLTGFGVAVATPGGDLLGYGLGWPPTWVTTAAAAEAWALSEVLELVPFPPPLRTDCLALLQTAREGTSKAIHHSKPLARIWKRIANTIDGDVSLLMNDDTLVWFPAPYVEVSWRSQRFQRVKIVPSGLASQQAG